MVTATEDVGWRFQTFLRFYAYFHSHAHCRLLLWVCPVPANTLSRFDDALSLAGKHHFPEPSLINRHDASPASIHETENAPSVLVEYRLVGKGTEQCYSIYAINS
jgi:hypothetical protein